MSAGLLAQYVVIGLIVLVSVLAVFRKLAPQLTNRWLAASSIRLGRPGRSRLAHAVGRRLQPKQATGNCSDGCSTCGACGPKKPVAVPSAASAPAAVRDPGTAGQSPVAAKSTPLRFRQRPH